MCVWRRKEPTLSRKTRGETYAKHVVCGGCGASLICAAALLAFLVDLPVRRCADDSSSGYEKGMVWVYVRGGEERHGKSVAQV